MINTILLAVIIMIELLFLLSLSKSKKEWLYGFIIVNLLLIATLGGKTVSFFGFTTNAGNIFYISVSLATYLAVEYFGSENAYKSIWLGTLAVFFFLVMTQLVISMPGTAETKTLNQAMITVFNKSARLGLASILGYLVAQSFSIWFYQILHSKLNLKNRALFLVSSNSSNILAQAVDSLLFFSIAFVGILPFSLLWQTVLVGYSLKVLAGLFMTPFLSWQLPQKR